MRRFTHRSGEELGVGASEDVMQHSNKIFHDFLCIL